LKTKNHLKKQTLQIKQQTLDLVGIKPSLLLEFDIDLLRLFTSLNIPIDRIDNQILKNFIEKYTKFVLKSASWYRKNLLEEVYLFDIKKHLEFFSDKHIFIMFDETTDSNGRYLLNILVGECSTDERKKPVLLRTVELTHTTAASINQEIIELIYRIFGTNNGFNKVLMLISDAAPYAIKAGKLLKLLCPNIKHVLVYVIYCILLQKR
jgi:hypothetical protein